MSIPNFENMLRSTQLEIEVDPHVSVIAQNIGRDCFWITQKVKEKENRCRRMRRSLSALNSDRSSYLRPYPDRASGWKKTMNDAVEAGVIVLQCADGTGKHGDARC